MHITYVLLCLMLLLAGCSGDKSKSETTVLSRPEEPSTLPYRLVMVHRSVMSDQRGHRTSGEILPIDPDRHCEGGSIHLIDNWRPMGGLSSAIFYSDRQGQRAQAHLHLPTKRIQDHLIHDFDGDGQCDLAVTYVTRDTMWLHVMSPENPTLFRLFLASGEDLDENGYWDGQGDLIDLFDVDADGDKELLIDCDANYDLYPRQLICVEPEARQVRWRFDIANIVGEKLKVIQDPRTDQPVLIVPLQSKGNAAFTDIMADSASYVAAFNGDGELLWYRQVGSVFEPATTLYADWDGDGYEDVYIQTYLHLDESDPEEAHGSGMVIVDATGRVLDSVVIDTAHLAAWIQPYDLNNDGEKEFVHRLSDGRLQIYNSRLERLASVKLPTRIASPMPIHDFTGTGEHHLMVKTVDRSLWLFDEYLNVVAYLASPPGTPIAWATPTERDGDYSLVLANQERSELFLYEVRPSGTVNFLLRHPWLVFLVVTVPLLIAAILLLLSWQRAQRQNLVISAQRDELNHTVEQLTHTQERLVEAEKLAQARKALEISEENFRNLAEYSLQGIIVHQDNKVAFVNSAACELLGRTEEELLGISDQELIEQVFHPESQTEIGERGQILNKGGDPGSDRYEVLINTGQGELRWMEAYSALSTFNGRPAIQVAFADVSDRRLADQALRDREKHYRLLVNSVRALIGLVERDGTLAFLNEPGAIAMGVDPETVVGRTVYDLFPGDAAERQMDCVIKALDTGEEQTLDALTYMRGEPRWYFSVVRPVADESGRAETALVIGTDVSQIRHAEVALKEERDFIRSLLDTATSLVVSLDKDACITEFNPECERITGYKREEVLGKHWPTLFLPEDLRAETPDDFLRWVRDNPRGMYEGRILTREGSERDILWSTSAIIPEDSDNITALAVGQDITERKQAEKALRESEERYRLLVDNVRAGIALVDRDGQFLFINEIGARAHGKPVDELIGKTMYQLFPADIADYQMQNVRTVIESGREFKEEAPTKVGDQWRWYFTNVQPFRNVEGETTAAMVIAHDITDTKKAQIALKEERDFVRSLLDTANSLILCLDSDARITVFNDECERVTGFKREEVMGKRWPEVFLPPEAQHEGLDDFVTWVKSHPRDSYEGPLRVRNGEIRTVLWSNSALISDDGKTVTALAVGQDITDRKRAEQAVRESEQRLRHLAEATPIPLSITGFPEGDILYYNQPMLDMFAITEDQVPEINIASFYVDLADRRALHEAVRADGGVRNYEIRGTNHHGVGFWVTISSQRTVYKGRQALVTGYYDVTERKRSENALRYRVHFEKLITSISTRFINIPSDRIESEVNKALREILDFTSSDIVSARLFNPDQEGRRFAMAAREEHRKHVEHDTRVAISENAWLRKALVEDGGLRLNSVDHARGLAPQAVTVMNELNVQSVLVVPIIYRHRLIGSLGLAHVDRDREWTDDEFALIKIVAEILANVFEHQRFEQELIKATRAKYDQVREIAGGVSHEIHNALFPATSGLEKLRQRLPDIEDPEHKRNRALLNLVDQSVSRAMSMTRLVTTLSRLESEKRIEQVWLSPLLESVVQANQGPLEQLRIDLTLDVPTDMAWSCSGEHAFSVCNNLVMNAIDALSEIDRKRTLSIRAVRDDGGIRLAVRDNGPGIPTENLSRVFDAFFSTKPRTGSGLGLAVVKRVLELYGGDITVRSRLDSGTEFVIFCPEYSP